MSHPGRLSTQQATPVFYLHVFISPEGNSLFAQFNFLLYKLRKREYVASDSSTSDFKLDNRTLRITGSMLRVMFYGDGASHCVWLIAHKNTV
jgi:hypothetical protein